MNRAIPYIDPAVKHVGISTLRLLNAAKLRGLDKLLVIQDNGNPLAVLLRYDTFLELQAKLEEKREETS